MSGVAHPLLNSVSRAGVVWLRVEYSIKNAGRLLSEGNCNTPPNTPLTATHCDTLQHTATHCNTLQHTATHRLTHPLLQHTATHCNTLQHTVTHCNTLQHTATHRNTLQHTATHHLTHPFLHSVFIRLWGAYDWYSPQNYRSVLQKSPIKETIFCRRDP